MVGYAPLQNIDQKHLDQLVWNAFPDDAGISIANSLQVNPLNINEIHRSTTYERCIFTDHQGVHPTWHVQFQNENLPYHGYVDDRSMVMRAEPQFFTLIPGQGQV